MRLYSIIRVVMNEHDIWNRPGVVEQVRSALASSPAPADNGRATLEAAVIVDGHRRALAEVGAADAVALVVDDLIVFEDLDRRPNDLLDLLLAFVEHAPAINARCRVLRLTVEHLDAGIHYVIELQARAQYPRGQAPVRLIISGRLAELQPRPRETTEDYRTRVEPLLQDRVALQAARASFESFTWRMRAALARAMHGAHATVLAYEPSTAVTLRDREAQPDDPDYDPHEVHYPNPMFPITGTAMLGAVGGR